MTYELTEAQLKHAVPTATITAIKVALTDLGYTDPELMQEQNPRTIRGWIGVVLGEAHALGLIKFTS